MKSLLFIFILLLISVAFAQFDSWNIELVGRVTEGPRTNIKTVGDSIVYSINSEDNFEILNIVDPDHPICISTLDLTRLEDFGIYDDHAFAITSGSILYTIDISAPESPEVVCSLDVPGDYRFEEIFAIEDFVFISDYENAIWVVDVHDPSASVVVDMYEVDEFYFASFFNENYGFILSPDSGLYILDNSDPSAMTVIGYFNTGGFSEYVDLYSENDFIYVANDYGIYILDISDPTSPNELSYIEIGWWTYEIFLEDDILFVSTCSGEFGTQLYDISNPSRPVLCGWFERTFGNLAVDSLLYLSSEDDLFVLDYTEAIPHDYTCTITPGWNLLSFPFSHYTTTEVLEPFVISSAYYFDTEGNNYFEEDTMEAGVGYFAYSVSDTFVNISETYGLDRTSKTLYPGWNLVGGPYNNIPVDEILSEAGVVPPIYGYDPVTSSYFEADTIRAMQGYWILYNGEEPSETTIP